MTKKHRTTTTQIASPSDLRHAAAHHPDKSIRRRAKALAQLHAGAGLWTVAQALHLSPRVLASWHARFEAAGIDGLADSHRADPLTDLPDSFWQEVDSLIQGDPIDYGYGPEDDWKLWRLCDELSYRPGIDLTPDELRAALLERDYRESTRIMDRRSRDQQCFEAYVRRQGADYRLLRAAEVPDAAHARVTIRTWSAPRQLDDHPPTEAEEQLYGARFRQLEASLARKPGG